MIVSQHFTSRGRQENGLLILAFPFFFWGSISTFTTIKGSAEDLTRSVDIGLAHQHLGKPYPNFD